MSIAFPVPVVDFADVIEVAGGTFRLSDSRKKSVSARGEVFMRQGSARRWEGDVTLVPSKNARAGGFDTLLDVLTGSGASALLYDHRRPFPELDPFGSVLGDSVVTIASVAGTFKELSLQGLPARYMLTRGDYLSFSYLDAASVQQWSLHRVVDITVEASAAGVIPTFEVSPHLPDDVTLVGLTVTLKKPVCKVVLQSVGHSRGSPGTVSEGQSFEFVQSRR